MSKEVSLEDSHPRQERCKYFGEELQMDASHHLWYGDTKAHLHISKDNSTGMITGAYFDEEETLNGYYNILYQTLTNYGIPYGIKTDNRTIFNYNSEGKSSVERNTFTQFSFACNTLGIFKFPQNLKR